jgi:hypothetical protein
LKKLVNSEPGTKFSVFPKTFSSSLGNAVTIEELFSPSFMQREIVLISSDECISPPKVFKKGKRHGQPSTKIDSINVTLEVNVSRDKNGFRPRV